jgi:hypothetical protein
MSITGKYLEAALLDQSVAGTFLDKKYAYVVVWCDGGWRLGIAVANEPGYNPVAKIFDKEADAREWAKGLNQHIGLSEDDAIAIIASTMGGRPVTVLHS